MQFYCHSLTEYQRLKTLEVRVGDLLLGNFHPIRVQTMTTTDTMDTRATVDQCIRCIDAGSELIRITAPSKKDAENLQAIRDELRRRGYHTPLVADIHFTPHAAEIAARIVEKVRVNPGNYIDKKKFEFIEYSDSRYQEEIQRIRERFLPLVRICKEYGTAMRIGTNHGSLSDRIMSRYGDTATGMVESAMEFLRVARDEQYHQIVLSMKSSNPLVMVQAYRVLVQRMQAEFGVCYPLHLGVTEAGDGEDGRIKSSIGIGSLLEDGIGDTIRVSLTEDPEFEIPVCQDLVKRYCVRQQGRPPADPATPAIEAVDRLPYSPTDYLRRPSRALLGLGGRQVPVVVADFRDRPLRGPGDLRSIGYSYDPIADKWTISDGAADFLYYPSGLPGLPLPGTLRVLADYSAWKNLPEDEKQIPVFRRSEWLEASKRSRNLNVILLDAADPESADCVQAIGSDLPVALAVYSSHPLGMPSVRRFLIRLMNERIDLPVILAVRSVSESIDEQLIHFATEAGSLFLDGMGDGIWLLTEPDKIRNVRASGRTYLEAKDQHQFLNNTSFSILQATRTRISKTEFISCPSCGRTLFDLQETTAKIRAVTHHLKGVKIAIMGCVVNGPGEMADADFGYVGSGPGKITLYKGKEVVKRGIESEVAVQELINLLKENDEWVNP
jgi:(E)-4-hydroxy-3-methylbut-2-enyl-diphosphate synthase